MRTVLMVAAGVAVGLTAAIAVLVEVLSRLLPLVLVGAVAVAVVRLVAPRRSTRLAREPEPGALAPVGVVDRPLDDHAPPIASDHAASYLQWGPPTRDDRLAAPITVAGGSHVRRGRAGAHLPRPAGGRRP